MTPFERMLKAIAPHFDSWEIIAEGLHAMPNIEDDIRKAQDSYNIRFTVHAPFSDLNIASLNPKIRESSVAQILEAIRICSDLGIRLVTLHPGYKSPLGAYFMDKVKEMHKKSMIEIDKANEEYGVVLALENLPKMWISLCSNAQEMKELIEGTNIKICFDVGHAHIAGEINDLLGLKKDFVNLHLHDNNGEKDKHLVIGEGNIDLKHILEELEGYEGIFVIESTNLEEGIKSKAILTEMLKDV